MLYETKSWLPSIFEIKDVTEASYVLEVKIIRNLLKKLLGLSRKNYIQQILEPF